MLMTYFSVKKKMSLLHHIDTLCHVIFYLNICIIVFKFEDELGLKGGGVGIVWNPERLIVYCHEISRLRNTHFEV